MTNIPLLSSEFTCPIQNVGNVEHQYLNLHKNKVEYPHYTMVLPVLFLARGRHFFQDASANHVIMGVLFSIILPVCERTGIIMGQNTTFFRGIMEKMPSEGLQNCPRAGGWKKEVF